MIFLRFFTEICQKLSFWWPAGYLPSNLSISGIFLKFPNFLRPYVLEFSVVWQLLKQLVHSFSGDNNLVLPHLWWREIVLKREKVPHVLSKLVAINSKGNNTFPVMYESVWKTMLRKTVIKLLILTITFKNFMRFVLLHTCINVNLQFEIACLNANELVARNR